MAGNVKYKVSTKCTHARTHTHTKVDPKSECKSPVERFWLRRQGYIKINFNARSEYVTSCMRLVQLPGR